MKRVKRVVLFVLMVAMVFMFSTCDQIDDLISSWAKKGVYVGVFAFQGVAPGASESTACIDLVYNTYNNSRNDEYPAVNVSATDLSLAFLDAANKDNINNNVLGTNSYKAGNSASQPLVYAVDQVIANLEQHKSTLQEKLTQITIVSFSTGADTVSSNFGGSTLSPTQYGSIVKGKIDNGIIRDGKTIPINACSVILSQTITQDMKNSVPFIVSGDGGFDNDGNIVNGNIIIAPDLKTNTLTPIFEKIADSISSIRYSGSTTITINGAATVAAAKLKDGNNFFASFDGKAPPGEENESTKYILGKVILNDNNRYEIINIKFYNGDAQPISLKNSEECARLSGGYFDFEFTDLDVNVTSFAGYRSNDDDGWTKITSDSSSTVKKTISEQKSSIVFLVLDSTMSAADINSVRSAARGFIDKIWAISRDPNAQ
jgi:hypothetical protein